MTKKVRKSVFETNSSSSHSLTMGKAALASQPFAPDVLRAGFIEVSLDDYGWEYRRLYRPEGKISYLLTQLGIGGQFDGRVECLDELCDENQQAAQLRRVVKEHTGCDIKLRGRSGSIDHQSVGVGLEVFNSDETLKQFLFSEDSFVQTGNDNSSAPWMMPTDIGDDELTYAAQIAEVPEGFTMVKLTAARSYGEPSFFTPKGAYLSPASSSKLYAKVLKEGIVTFVDVKHVGYSDPSSYGSSTQSEWAREVVDYGLRLSRDFNAELTFTKGQGYESTGTLSVKLPVGVARSIKALAATPPVLVELADITSRLKDCEERIAKAKSSGKKPGKWETDNLRETRATFKKLTAKAQAEGVL